MNKIRNTSDDKATKKTNNVFRQRYLYLYRGKIEDLKVEIGKSLGFELWSIEKLNNLSDSDRGEIYLIYPLARNS